MLIQENKTRSSAEIQNEIEKLVEIQKTEKHTYDQINSRLEDLNAQDLDSDNENRQLDAHMQKMMKTQDILIDMRKDLVEKQLQENQVKQYPANLVQKIENLVRTQESNEKTILQLLGELKRRMADAE
jgi:hypothetical protein